MVNSRKISQAQECHLQEILNICREFLQYVNLNGSPVQPSMLAVERTQADKFREVRPPVWKPLSNYIYDTKYK